MIKRKISERDFVRLPTGKVVPPYWAKERLRNEAATLEFVSSRTTIPVPRCRLYTDNGLLCLEKTRIHRVLLIDIEGTARAAAIEAIEEQINTTIPPQLRSLRRAYIGSVDDTLPVFPP